MRVDVRPLVPQEVAAAVEIFGRAFEADVDARAMLDTWRFLQQAEPDGFLAAYEDGRIVGYAIFVRSLGAVQRRALLSGHLFRVVWNAVRGRYRLRLAGLLAALGNKASFVASSRRYRTEGDAQLLNVAVDPAARGRGIGKALVLAGLRYLAGNGVREARLEVRPWNAAAVRVYAETGWRDVGRTRDAQGEWIVMVAKP